MRLTNRQIENCRSHGVSHICFTELIGKEARTSRPLGGHIAHQGVALIAPSLMPADRKSELPYG